MDKWGEVDEEKFKVSFIDAYRIIQSRVSVTQGSLDLITKPITSTRAAAPWLLRMCKDMYDVDPWLFKLGLLREAWNAVHPGLRLYVSNWLLSSIEDTGGDPRHKRRQVLYALLVRVGLHMLEGFIRARSVLSKDIFEAKATQKFQEMNIANQLQYDLQTRTEEHLGSEGSSVVSSFNTLVTTIKEFSNIAIQLSYVSTFRKRGPSGLNSLAGRLLFTAMCVINPIWSTLNVSASPHGVGWVAHIVNPALLRIKTLTHIVNSSQYMKEIIASDMAGYIMAEYRTARQNLGNVVGHSAWASMTAESSALSNGILAITNDIPTIYFAASFILDPTNVSVSSLAMLQQSSQSLHSAFWKIKEYFKRLPMTMGSIERVYNSEVVVKKVLAKNGTIAFPAQDHANDKGMKIEFRNVTFEYPTSKKTSPALRNISFTLNSGDFVIVVGANGSGKSTAVKLLNRLYDVEDGVILIDDIPIKDYDVRTIRHAIADLSQDHHLLPISIGENIGIGLASDVKNEAMIRQAAEAGGALGIVDRFQDGLDTVLQPIRTKQMSAQRGSELVKISRDIERSVETSGGEQQRLVASRVFMRLHSPLVKLITVDEPSSAMDPEAEFKLFERLREAQQGRTMVLVTHRFGHLTPIADQIICMNDGQIVEQGTHAQLMVLDGEYAKMYNIQTRP